MQGQLGVSFTGILEGAGMSADLFICPDCEQPTAIRPDSLCASCQSWREDKLGQMDTEWIAAQQRRERRRMTPKQRFAEDLADMIKGMERSKRTGVHQA